MDNIRMQLIRAYLEKFGERKKPCLAKCGFCVHECSQLDNKGNHKHGGEEGNPYLRASRKAFYARSVGSQVEQVRYRSQTGEDNIFVKSPTQHTDHFTDIKDTESPEQKTKLAQRGFYNIEEGG